MNSKIPSNPSQWRLLVAGVATFAIVIGATAGESKNPVAQQLDRQFDWTGFYVGANIGGALSDYEFLGRGPDGDLFADVDLAQQFYGIIQRGVLGQNEFGDVRVFGANDEERRGSVLGGGQIGYNRQFGHFVVGIEGDFDRTSERGSTAFKDSNSAFIVERIKVPEVEGETDFTGTRRAESNWNGSVRGRFGFAQGPFMFYGTAGIVWADVRVLADDLARTNFFAASDGMRPPEIPSLPSFGNTRPTQPAQDDLALYVGTVTSRNISRDDDIFVGWTAGGGIEWAISDTVSLGLDYRHNDLGGETHTFSSHGGPIFPAPTHVDLTSDQVTVRLNVMLSHLFGHQDYASTTTRALLNPFASGNDVAVAYHQTSGTVDDLYAKKENAATEEGSFSWTGFYLGANIGGAWSDYDFGTFDTFVSDHIFTDYRFRTPSIDGGSDDSIIGGGQAGYQYQWHHFVFGVEGDFSGMSSDRWTRFDSTQSEFIDLGKGFFNNVTNLTTLRRAEVDWQASARARLGWAQGRLLLYVTGGGTWADVRTWATDSITSDYFFDGDIFDGGFSDHNQSQNEKIVCGWTAGGGAEWAFTKMFSMGLEYRHSVFGDETFSYDSRHSFAIRSGSTSVDLDSDQMTFKVNVLLGRIPGP